MYGAQVGGVWDALLGEGRNFWFFASSDWHNRGSFGPDDRRSTQDFYPGEYQRNYTMVRNGTTTSCAAVDRRWPAHAATVFAASGSSSIGWRSSPARRYPGRRPAPLDAAVEAMAVAAAAANTDTDIDVTGCATMGEKLMVRPGAEIVVSIVVRDPAGTNYSPYTFHNPSLLQIGVNQPLNTPVLDHIDLIRGMVTGYRTPGAPDYAGEWPRNTTGSADGTTATSSAVPAAAKNTTAAVIKTFNERRPGTPVRRATSDVPEDDVPHSGGDGVAVRAAARHQPAAGRAVRDRCQRQPAGRRLHERARHDRSCAFRARPPAQRILRTACPYTGTEIDGCPTHLTTAHDGTRNPIAGQKACRYDVAAWSDLWFYSNPIYVEVQGSTRRRRREVTAKRPRSGPRTGRRADIARRLFFWF